MDTIGIRSLRENLTATLERVRTGETIEVTHHGRPVALLGPVPQGDLERLIRSGEVKPASGSLPNITRHLAPGLTASEALEEDRTDR